MASIIDSFRETVLEKFSLVKIFVLTIPVYYCYCLYVKQNMIAFQTWILIAIFLYLGLLSSIVNRNLTGKDKFVTLNPVEIAADSVLSLLAILPSAVISYYLAPVIINLISPFFVEIPNSHFVVNAVVWLVLGSFIVTSFLLKGSSKKFYYAYNIKKLFKHVGDVLAEMVIFALKAILINCCSAVPIYFAIKFLFQDGGIIFDFIMSMLVVFNFIMFGYYLSNIYRDVIDYNPSNFDIL